MITYLYKCDKCRKIQEKECKSIKEYKSELPCKCSGTLKRYYTPPNLGQGIHDLTYPGTNRYKKKQRNKK